MTKKNDTTKGRYYETIASLFNSIHYAKEGILYSWKKSFITIHGEYDCQRSLDFEKLSDEFHVQIDSDDSAFTLIFCIESYYSIVLRVLAYKALDNDGQFSLQIFDDSFFKGKGICNYSCPAEYNWFLSVPHISELLEPVFYSYQVDNLQNEIDFISVLFESIFPKDVRHSLGEYYTPYWLAKYIVDSIVTGDLESENRFYIDPTCGTGTFLIVLLDKFGKDNHSSIWKHICGIDINPLTAFAAKTNYLIRYCLIVGISSNSSLTIPIYHADAIGGAFSDDLIFQMDVDRYDEIPNLRYDYVVGNPPWVNWEYLPRFYKLKYAHLWNDYGLFEKTGKNMNFIKEDISVLLTYVFIDRFLHQNGKIGILLKETLFKSINQGEGFRYFYLKNRGTGIQVQRVEDLSDIKPFSGAVTRTAILFARKGDVTKYPVDYITWTRTGKHKITSISDIDSIIQKIQLKARPADSRKINSGWITESPSRMGISEKILGTNEYSARTGVFTGGANGIYWLQIHGASEGVVAVENITERAKNKMKKVHAELEQDFVFPLLTGKELKFWDYSYSKYILCPHTVTTKMEPIGHENLNGLPLTKSYFNAFKKELVERKGFTSLDENIHQKYYYTLQRIGDYTFSPYKVCWRFISKSFIPAVVEYASDPFLGEKNIICNEKIIFIGLNDRFEAYYLCGVLSSTPFRETIESYMIGTQITPSILKRLNIPSFNPDNPLHVRIADQCILGHADKQNMQRYLGVIDTTVKELFQLE